LGTDTTAPYSWSLTNVAAGSYSYTAKAYDSLNAVTTSAAVSVTVSAPNTPPAITALTATPQTLNDTATSQLQVVASDPDAAPSPLSYAWSIVSGGGSLSSSTAANPVYTPANVSATTPVSIKVTVSDGAASVNQSITLTVNDTAVATETVVYYHNDALGSPVAATDATGNLLWRESYRPYGERLNNAPAGATNPLWYTGKRQDPETGLVYMGARYYNPALGRFLSIDPVEPDENNLHSLNRYAYANNNPYKFTDPDGQVAETVIDIVSLGLSIQAYRQDPGFLNGLAVAYDGFATAVPFLPAGIGIIRQAATKGSDVTQAVKQAADRGAAKAGEGAQKTVSREERWRHLASQENTRLPKEVVDHIQRHGGKGVSDRFGLELAHRPKKAASQGHDYSEAIPKTAADHRGIQHRYLRERSTGTSINVPSRARSGGSLDLPPPGALP
jgi:RHS repeat-associated protein